MTTDCNPFVEVSPLRTNERRDVNNRPLRWSDRMRNQPNIAVLGGGVVGLTVAKMAQDHFTMADITVLADSYTETTSFMADGVFRPGASFKGPTKKITKKWVIDSWHYWQDLLKTPEAPKIGVSPLSAIIFSKQNDSVVSNPLIEDLVPIYRPVNSAEFRFAPKGTKFGSFFSTLKVDCERYLPWVEKVFIKKGGQLMKIKIDSLSSLSNYDLVFNCSGLGAKYLCNDQSIVPIRCQVLKVDAPWLERAVFGDYDTYVCPGLNGIVTLGGVRHYNSYNMEYCRNDAASIMERCCELIPRLRGCEVVDSKVGLRPHRVPVRVEAEVIDKVNVVHCYGHGACGVATAPGTAMYAVEMGANMLRRNSAAKKM